MIVGKSVILQRYRSPCGEMMLGAIGDSICLCGWIGRSGYERDLARVTKHFGACVVHGTCPVIDIAAEQLDEYFAGERKVFALPLVFSGTEFQNMVWNGLLRIPYGVTISYGEEASRLGCPKSVRAVASANGANPIGVIVPCHRVIGADGSLTGYSAGTDIKAFLLRLEGIDLF